MDINVTPIAGNYHLNNSHNLQPNANTYFVEKKYVSIHSEDRNFIMYPKSGDFQITLPQTLNNVIKVRLATYDFPSNYDVFSRDINNINLAVSMGAPYFPTGAAIGSLYMAIYECLLSVQDTNIIVTITSGFYTPTQMVTELTNKLNKTISDLLNIYVLAHLSTYSALLPITDTTYNRFVVIYNEVKQNIWFGNRADPFTLNNSLVFAVSQGNVAIQCTLHPLPNFSNWGLPYNLGLKRTNNTSESANYVRIFYGELTPGDDGFWLTPIKSLANNLVYYVECPNKINLMGCANFYLNISKFNCLDTTVPFSVNNNDKIGKPNGITNFALAKIQIPTTPVTQWFGQNPDNTPYAYFNPPLDKVSQLFIKLTYHDGTTVDFQNFNFSFMIEFDILQPQILRKGQFVTPDQGLVLLQPPLR
jgi:hypothetical protein